MSQVTAQQVAKNNTTQSFLSAFVTNVALLAVEFGAFVLLRQHFKRVYSPRTYLPPPDKRSKELPSGLWRWFFALITSNSENIIHTNGLDAYMFIRFLQMLIWMFAFYTFVTWAILLAVDSAGIPSSAANGLGQFNWSNIPQDQSQRYAAHVVVVYLLTFFTLWLVRRESLHFISLRQQFLISPSHSRTAQARTVLITSVPDELASDEKALRKWASFVPGGVGRIWIYRDTKALNEEYARRVKATAKLEGAVSKVLRTATKAWYKRVNAAEKAAKKERKATAKGTATTAPDLEKQPTNAMNGVESGPSEDASILPKPDPTMDSLLELVPREKWPKHKLGKIPFIGKKVDTFDWCRQEIAEINADIPGLRHKYQTEPGKLLGAVFIECNLQIGAHVLAQCVSYHEPLMMVDKWVDVHNKDVIWKNLDDGSLETRSRFVISWALTIALIVLWSIPVAFVGTVSNLGSLCKEKWLQWICKAPTPAPGIISGLLPPILLAVLFILLPIILRMLAIYECVPRFTMVDLSVYKRYYVFLVVHGFLVVTLSSGLTAAIPQIVQDPANAVTTLASQLPASGVFFLTYMVTQAFAGAGMALLQIVPLIMHFIKKKFMGETPRQAFNVTFLMPCANFSLVLPRMSLLATIGIAYSVLSPIINGLALAGYALWFLSWKFLLIYVFDQPDQVETGGLYFPLAISNLFTGLYVEQVVLAVLFFLNAGGHLAFLASGILMVVLLLITLAVHILINKAVQPVTSYLPMSLATKKLQERYDLHQKKHMSSAQKNQEEEESDMFSRNRVQSVIKRRVRKVAQTIEEKILKEDPKEDKGKAGETAPAATTATGVQSSNTPLTTPGADPALARHDSSDSDMSHPSKKKVSHQAEQIFDPASSRVRDEYADNDVDYDEEIEEHAFDHPSTYAEARWIWVPHDELGFSTLLIDELKMGDGEGGGVNASDLGARMDKKGAVEVSRNPPDEDWAGGFDK